MRILIVVAICFLVAPVSQAETLEDLLAEKGVITQSESRAISQDGPAKVYYQDGTRLAFPSDGFELKINTLLQTRYTFRDDDADVGLPDSSSFDVRRARIIVTGTALDEEFSYRLETAFVGDKEDGRAKPDLGDAYIQWNTCDWASIRLGQMKTSLSRQHGVEPQYLQIPERSSVAGDTFSTDRQQGVQLYVNDEDQRYLFVAGIYNGESDDEGGVGGGRNHSGQDTRMMGDVMLRANIVGEMDPYVEGDIDMTEDWALNAGIVYNYSDAKNDPVGLGLADTKLQRFNVDASVKVQGFSLHGEYYYGKFENDLLSEDSKPGGGYVQAGYFFDPAWEIAGRWGFTDCDKGTFLGACSAAAGYIDDTTEVAASLNYHWWKHNLKAQLAWLFVNSDLEQAASDAVGEKDVQTNRWIIQLSAYL